MAAQLQGLKVSVKPPTLPHSQHHHPVTHTGDQSQALVAEQEEELLDTREQCAALAAANRALQEELDDLRMRCVGK